MEVMIPFWIYPMDYQETKKLKRGLKDLSPLFQGASEALPPPSAMSAGLPVASAGKLAKGISWVVSVDRPEENHFLTSWLVAYLASHDERVSVASLSLKSPSVMRDHKPEASEVAMLSYPKHLRRFWLSWENFTKACAFQNETTSFEEFSLGHVFVDFNCKEIDEPERVFHLLDRIILFVRPTLKSLTETYRFLKILSAWNYPLDYFVLFDESLPKEKTALLFEQFSEMAAKFIDASIYSLGFVDPYGSFEDISLLPVSENLFFRDPYQKINTPEKMGFTRYLVSLLDGDRHS